MKRLAGGIVESEIASSIRSSIVKSVLKGEVAVARN